MTATCSNEGFDGGAAPFPSSVVSLPAAQMLRSLLRIGEETVPAPQFGSTAARGLFLRQTADVLRLLRTQFRFTALAYEAQCVSLETPDELVLSPDNLKEFLQMIDRLVEKTEKLGHDMSTASC